LYKFVAAALLMSGAANAQEKPPEVAQTQPVRRMVWDRARVAVDLARREAQAKRAVEVLERQADGHAPDAEQAKALLRARNELETIRKAVEDARQTMAAGIVLEKAAYLGIATTPAPPVLRKHLKLPDGVGLVVDFVEPGSPAAEAGVQRDDCATKLNDQLLVNSDQLAVLVRTFDPGTEVTLTVYRSGKPRALPVTLVEKDVRPLTEVGVEIPGQPRHFINLTRDDLVLKDDDTPLGPGDMMRVTIHDLAGAGAQTWIVARVEKDGGITLPQLKAPVPVNGLSGRKLVDTIREAYRDAGVLKNPHISVQVMRRAETPKKK
jgi:hypothetical protein